MSQQESNIGHTVLKKSERISAALYLVTGLLSDNEPLKWKLRDASLRLLADLYGSNADVSVAHVFYTKKSIAKEMHSLIEMGRLAGVISTMNATILGREIDVLIRLCDEASQSGEPIQHFSLKSDFFGETRALTQEAYTHQTDEYSRGNDAEKIGRDAGQTIKDIQQSEGRIIKDTHVLQSEQPRSTPIPADEVSSRSVVQTSEGSRALPEHGVGGGSATAQYAAQALVASDKKRKSRRDMIMRALRKKSRLTIKEITRVVPGCSEKTIQRELIALIKDNMVTREGERRWSRYSLVSGDTVGA